MKKWLEMETEIIIYNWRLFYLLFSMKVRIIAFNGYAKWKFVCGKRESIYVSVISMQNDLKNNKFDLVT
jgi:hypothetical protein